MLQYINVLVQEALLILLHFCRFFAVQMTALSERSPGAPG